MRANSVVRDFTPSLFSRRRFLGAVAIGQVTLLASAVAGGDSGRVHLEPTPAVGAEPTPEETTGPFFRPDSPLRGDFRATGIKGIPVRLSGLVLDDRGRTIPGVLLDFWHANADGEYDLKGFGCRGHQFSDPSGRYFLETVVPGLYPGRTRHYHVRLQAAHGPILSTQLYFPEEARNATDALFRPDLLLKMREAGGLRLATFNFVLATV
ncbi:MAG TPA: hypothetical protein VGD78_00910 [Chthoniobacterales bacterium]